MYEAPLKLGWEAGLRGDDPRLCPFEKMTREYYEWQRWHAFGIAFAYDVWPGGVGCFGELRDRP